MAIGFKWFKGDDLYIANIYASNKMHERIEMWEAMVHCLPRGGQMEIW